MNRRIFLVLVVAAMVTFSICATVAAMSVEDHSLWVALSLLAAFAWAWTGVVGLIMLIMVLIRTYGSLPH